MVQYPKFLYHIFKFQDNIMEKNKYQLQISCTFIAMYITQLVLLNRFIGTDYFYLTGGTFIYFVTPLNADLIAEIYGPNAVKTVINWACGLMLGSALLIYICIHIPGPSHWKIVTDAYTIALDSILRTAVIGAIMIFIGQRINAYLILKWKKAMRSKYFSLRSSASSIVGDSVTVTFTSIFVFLGRGPEIKNLILSNILPELIVMIIISLVGSIIANYAVYYLAKSEGIKRETAGSTFNPFID